MDRGCPIPDETDGEYFVWNLNVPASWRGLISENLYQLCAEDFWDRRAAPEDIDIATQAAHNVVACWLGPDCEPIPYENSPVTGSDTTEYDFAGGDGGWFVEGNNNGVYQYGHWESSKYFDGSYWHSNLEVNCYVPHDEIWPYRIKLYTELNCFSGPMLTFPNLRIYFWGYEVDPVAVWKTEFNAGFWSQASFRPEMIIQNYRSVKSNMVTVFWHAVAASEEVINSAYCVLTKVELQYDY